MTDDDSSTRRRGWMARLGRALRRRSADPQDAALNPVDVIREREEAGETLERDQRDMIVKVTHFDRLRASDVMVARSDIVAVDADDTLEEVARVFTTTQHSRLPIIRDGLDNPIGMVHVKDVLALLSPPEGSEAAAKPGDRILSRVRRDVLFVPPSMKLPTLLLKMRSQRCHLALIIDEYGGTEGLATIEDLVEQIVGDIDDEHDDEEAPAVIARAVGVWESEAATEIPDFEKETGVDLTLEEHEDAIDTLGGLVVALAGRVPARGEIVRHPAGYDLEVLEADPRRVKRLLIRRVQVAEAGEGHA